ncbi:unnamed protein product [Cuscuta campestris]|uniref:Uncharacterized protein n=1 Tax=Cuscuta campestris TaxID=132261 RepID=A0A484MJF8_9ASTE|nr:unnamed protein product [Cuscuta campestris]
MILRTPPVRKRKAESEAKPDEAGSPVSNRQQLVIYEDEPSALESSQDHHFSSDQMLCTYQCRQMVKSEFFDALSTAEKQAQDFNSKFKALNDELHKADAERKKYRDQFLYAEQELAAAKGREESLQEQLLKEIDCSQERLTKQLQLYSELEVKFQHEKNLRAKAESAAASAEEKASLYERKHSSLSESMEREKRRLHNELEQLKTESSFSVSSIKKNLERMECRAVNAEKESALLKEQLQDVIVRLNECMEQRMELEKLSSFTFRESSSTDDSILVKHLQEELRHYEAEVREARKLKSSHENIELLKEKLLEEKGRRDRAESELVKLADLEVTVKKLEDELSTWKSVVLDIPGISCADDIPRKFASLQKEVLDSMIKMGEAQASLKQMEVALDNLKLENNKSEADINMAKENAELLMSELKRTELMLSSVLEERDRLKHIVDELRTQKSVGTGIEASHATLVQELEASLAKKDSCIKELESSLSEQREINTRKLNELKLLNDMLSNEARRIKSLEREGDRLRSEIALLESKLGHGDYSSANTKVLRMVNTLGVDNEAKQTIEVLQSELQKTKEKLQALEELKQSDYPADAGTLVDSYISGKILQLKEQIATLEKREER